VVATGSYGACRSQVQDLQVSELAR